MQPKNYPAAGSAEERVEALKLFPAVYSQAAQAHYVWVRASEIIWLEYTRIKSVSSDAK